MAEVCLLLRSRKRRIWTPPRLQVNGLWQLARLQTYIRPLQMASTDAGP